LTLIYDAFWIIHLDNVTTTLFRASSEDQEPGSDFFSSQPLLGLTICVRPKCRVHTKLGAGSYSVVRDVGGLVHGWNR
jgi:hypothetical protein